MMELPIANMPILQNFKTLRPPQGLEEANVVHQPGPDQLRQIPHPSRPKLDQGRPPREGFGSISLKAWEEIAGKIYGLYFYCYVMFCKNHLFVLRFVETLHLCACVP